MRTISSRSAKSAIQVLGLEFGEPNRTRAYPRHRRDRCRSGQISFV